MLKTGKLYKGTNTDFLLYPTIEDAVKCWTKMADFPDNTTMFFRALKLSQKFGCKIGVLDKGAVFMPVEEKLVDGFSFVKILSEQKLGWITYQEWHKFNQLI